MQVSSLTVTEESWYLASIAISLFFCEVWGYHSGVAKDMFVCVSGLGSWCFAEIGFRNDEDRKYSDAASYSIRMEFRDLFSFSHNNVHHLVWHQETAFLTQCAICTFLSILTMNTGLFPEARWRIGPYNWDELRSLSERNGIFIYSVGGSQVFERLKHFFHLFHVSNTNWQWQ
jgi:hypothetical protein